MDLDRAHATLGVAASTPIEEVRQRYLVRARMVHPDRLANEPDLAIEAHRAMSELNAAWKAVSEAEERGERGRAEMAPDPEDPSRLPVNGECDLCGVRPATPIRLKSVTGLIVVSRHYSSHLELCRSCGTTMFREVQSTTLIRGWWGLFAFFYNVGAIISNISAVNRHKATVPPGQYRDAAVVAPVPPGMPLSKPVMKRVGSFVAPGIAVWIIAGLVAAGVSENNSGGGSSDDSQGSRIGMCLTAGGRETDCDFEDAAYEIEEEVAYVDDCGARFAFEAENGGIFCARRL